MTTSINGILGGSVAGDSPAAANTQPTSSRPWDRLAPRTRQRLVRGLWWASWVQHVFGFLLSPHWFDTLLLFSLGHALLFVALFAFEFRAFPVQVRIAFALWIAAGTAVPGGGVMLAITAVGLLTNLGLGYCPLARMVWLLPWNRREAFTLNLVWRVMSTAPSPGAFVPRGRRGSGAER